MYLISSVRRKVVALFFVILMLSMPIDFALGSNVTITGNSTIEDSQEGLTNGGSLNVEFPEYGNSRDFLLSGSATPSSVIDLYVNSNLFMSVLSDSEGNFEFRRVLLDSSGENNLRVVMTNTEEGVTSEASGIVLVDDTVPELISISVIPSAFDGQMTLNGEVSEEVTVYFKDTVTSNSFDSTNSYIDSPYIEDSTGEDSIGSESVSYDAEEISTGSKTFEYQMGLEDGNHEIEIYGVDKGGNKFTKSYSTYVDSTPPVILENNIADVSPTYSKDVTIRGRVSEPSRVSIMVNTDTNSMYQCSNGVDDDEDGYTDYGQDPGCSSPTDQNELQTGISYACSNTKDDDEDGLTDFPYDPGCDSAEDNDEEDFSGESECGDGVDNDLDGKIDYAPATDGDLGCESLSDNDESDDPDIGNVYFVETDDEGYFSKTIDLGSSFGGKFADLVSSVKADSGNDIALSFESTSIENDIKIVAVDRAGLSSTEEGVVEYASCSSGEGDFLVYQKEVFPATLVPDHIFQGMATISFALELEPFIDSIDYSSVSVNFDTRKLSNDDKSKWDMDIFDPSSCTASSDGSNTRWYVTCRLKRYPPSPYRNITAAYEEFKDQGFIKIPMNLRIDYSIMKTTSKGEEVQGTTKSQLICYDLEFLLDLRLEPDHIPRNLLNKSVKVLDETIDAIDDTLEVVTQAKWITAGACGAMYVNSYVFGNIGKTFACKDVPKDCKVEIVKQIRGTKDMKFDESKVEKRVTVCKDGNNEVDISSCGKEISEFLRAEKKRHYVCDRIFCPTVPTLEKYIYDQSSYKASESPCSDVNSDEECRNDYKNEWASACVGMDILEKSDKLSGKETEEKTGVWNKIKSLFSKLKEKSDFCRSSENNKARGVATNYYRNGYAIRENTDGKFTIGTIDESAKDGTDGNIDKTTETGKFSPSSIHYLDTDENVLAKDSIVTQNLGKKGDCLTFKNDLKYNSGEAKGNNVVIKKITATNKEEKTETVMMSSVEGDLSTYEKGDCENAGSFFVDANSMVYCEKGGKYYQAPYFYVKKNSKGFNGQLFDPSNGEVPKDCLNDNIVNEESVVEILVDPTGSLITSIQCLCLPALEGYLTQLKGILNSIKNCFQSILITGEFNAGVCKAILTQYLCDFVYDILSCIPKSFGTGGSTTHNPFKNFFSDLKDAGESIKKKSMERYGNTATFQNLFSERQLIHSACLAAFGYDWSPDLKSALTVSGGEFDIETVALLSPVNRRFITFDPNNEGAAEFIYHVGYFLTAGSDINWRLELGCSNTNDCDASEFTNGMCDCANPGFVSPIGTATGALAAGASYNPYAISTIEPGFGYIKQSGIGGFLEAGQSVGGGSSQTNFGTSEDGNVYLSIKDSVRYDKARIVWTNVKNSSKTKSTKWVKIATDGTPSPPTCNFDLMLNKFSCGYNAPADGFVYFSSVAEMENGVARVTEPGESYFKSDQDIEYQVNYVYKSAEDGQDETKRFIRMSIIDENSARVGEYYTTTEGEVESSNGKITLPANPQSAKDLLGAKDGMIKAKYKTAIGVGGNFEDKLVYDELGIISNKLITHKIYSDSNYLLVFINSTTNGKLYYNYIKNSGRGTDQDANIKKIIEGFGSGAGWKTLNVKDLKGTLGDYTLTFDTKNCKTKNAYCVAYYEMESDKGVVGDLTDKCEEIQKSAKDYLPWKAKFEFMDLRKKTDGTYSEVKSPSIPYPGKEVIKLVDLKISCSEFGSYDAEEDKNVYCPNDVELTSDNNDCKCGSETFTYSKNGNNFCTPSGIEPYREYDLNDVKLQNGLRDCPMLVVGSSSDILKGFYSRNKNGKCTYSDDLKKVCYFGDYYDVETSKCSS